MEKLVISLVETELRKVFIPQQHPQSVMNTFLTSTYYWILTYIHFFNWILIDIQSLVEYFWHSIYNVHRAESQSIIELILTFSLQLAL